MASLLTEPLFEKSGQGPAPNRNFYHFAVSKSSVIWRWWKISPRAVDRYSKPGELKVSHQDFLDDTWLHSEISMVFGRRILQYTKALCQGHYDYLERLPDSLLLQVINYLELEDVGQLGRTSRRFRQLCGSEEFWEQAVQQRCNTVTAEVASLALDIGWRRIFFTSKLQLQKLISRRKLKTEEHQKGKASDPDTKAEGFPDGSSEEESHLGADPGTQLDTSSCGEVDPGPNCEPQSGFDSSVSVACQLMEGMKSF